MEHIGGHVTWQISFMESWEQSEWTPLGLFSGHSFTILVWLDNDD